MHPHIYLAFTLVELIIVIAIIAIIAAIAIPKLISAHQASKCLELAEKIKKELAKTEEIAKKLYDGDTSVKEDELNKNLGNVTEKLKKLHSECGGRDNSVILSEIDSLVGQLKQYVQKEISPEEKSLLDSALEALDVLKKKLTK